jgi:sulfatase maturation enzyme AslB (radical SAM superfamily)
MPNKFCRYLSNGYSFFSKDQNQILVKPCCWYQGPALTLDSNIDNQRRALYDSIDTWTDNCAPCRNLENINQQSLRQTGPEWIDDSVSGYDVVSVDVRLDNNCNAACIICNAESSSLWQKEINKNQNQKIKIFDQAQNNQPLVELIANTLDLSKLRYVKFYGGEPLFTDTHLRFLREIPNPENVTLHYTTNASIYPDDDTFDLWQKFKVIIFVASLDGVNEQFDYIRWPLSWTKVSENLVRLRNDPRTINIMFRVEFTANFLNTYYYDTLEHWVQTNFNSNFSGDKTEINIHLCHGGTWDPKFMPWSIRNQILSKYHPTSVIYKLVKNLPDPVPSTEWKKFVKTWESRRKNNWRQTFSELDFDNLL